MCMAIRIVNIRMFMKNRIVDIRILLYSEYSKVDDKLQNVNGNPMLHVEWLWESKYSNVYGNPDTRILILVFVSVP